MIIGHGSDRYKYEDIEADFSSNVWYEGVPKGLKEHLFATSNDWMHYPEPDAYTLSEKLAEHHDVTPESILVTNGASEAFYLLAQLFKKGKSAVMQPAFAEYKDSSLIFDHKVTDIDTIERLHHYLKRNPEGVVWIGNPNNPDGKITPIAQILMLCSEYPKNHFIVDEAYIELCSFAKSGVPYVEKCSNLIITKSLTKVFSIPALRLGYLVANKKIIDKLKKIKMPWSVNTLAIEAGYYLIDRYDSLAPNRERVYLESRKFQKQLKKIEGITVLDSTTNYFLIKIEGIRSDMLKKILAQEYKILIRDASNFCGLSNEYIRVALQSPKKNRLLLNALEQILKKQTALVV